MDLFATKQKPAPTKGDAITKLNKDILVGIEACASSHHWSRELQGLAILSV